MATRPITVRAEAGVRREGRWLPALLCLWLAACSALALAQDAPEPTKPTEPTEPTEVRGLVRGGTVFVPLRALCDALGATISLSQGSVIISHDGHSVSLAAGRPKAIVDGVSQNVPVAPFEAQGRMMVPLRLAGETLGAKVGWDRESGVATLSADGKTVEVRTAHVIQAADLRVTGLWFEDSLCDISQGLGQGTITPASSEARFAIASLTTRTPIAGPSEYSTDQFLAFSNAGTALPPVAVAIMMEEPTATDPGTWIAMSDGTSMRASQPGGASPGPVTIGLAFVVPRTATTLRLVVSSEPVPGTRSIGPRKGAH